MQAITITNATTIMILLNVNCCMRYDIPVSIIKTKWTNPMILAPCLIWQFPQQHMNLGWKGSNWVFWTSYFSILNLENETSIITVWVNRIIKYIHEYRNILFITNNIACIHLSLALEIFVMVKVFTLRLFSFYNLFFKRIDRFKINGFVLRSYDF